jgi:hypothetical protein
MNEQTATIEELIKRLSDMEASQTKLKEYAANLEARIAHLETKNPPPQRGGITRVSFGG